MSKSVQFECDFLYNNNTHFYLWTILYFIKLIILSMRCNILHALVEHYNNNIIIATAKECTTAQHNVIVTKNSKSCRNRKIDFFIIIIIELAIG